MRQKSFLPWLAVVTLVPALASGQGAVSAAATPAPSASRTTPSPNALDASNDADALARDRIVAAVRPRSYLERIDGTIAASLVTEPFAGDLVLLYMEDRPESARALQIEELDALGVTRESLGDLARHNLDARLTHLDAAIVALARGTIVPVQTGSYFEVSRLMQRDSWTALAASSKATIVVSAPASDLLLVTLDPSKETLSRLRAATLDLHAKAYRPISTLLFRWTDDGWVVLR